MGGDSCSKGLGFESRHHILDGHVFTFICCKNCNDVCLLEKTANKRLKRPGLADFLKGIEETANSQNSMLCMYG